MTTAEIVKQPADHKPNTLTNLRDYHEIARTAPERDLQKIWDNITKELTFAPDAAQKAWYSIPYKDKGRVVPVEGIGIHGFTVLIRHWGYAYSAGVFGEDLGDKFVGRGRFVDLKTMVPIERDVAVNRYQVSKDGRTYRLSGKHWDNAVQSAISKAQRNAGLQGIPEYLKEKFFALVKKLSLEEKDPKTRTLPTKERIAKAKEQFIKKFKITPEVFDGYLGGLSVETDDEVLTHLKGLYNALQSGEETVQSVFGVEPPEKKVMTRPEEKGTGDDQPGI